MGVEQDAREFGLHVRQGGWRLGLLVARNVQSRGKGRPKKEEWTDDENAGIPAISKVPIARFAELAELDRETVKQYLDAWDRAADMEVVPKREALQPEKEVELGGLTTKDWDKFYTPRKRKEKDDEPPEERPWETVAKVTETFMRETGPISRVKDAERKEEIIVILEALLSHVTHTLKELMNEGS